MTEKEPTSSIGSLLFDRLVVKRAFVVSVVVGTALILINQYDVLAEQGIAGIPPVKLLLTFLVPYLVSTGSSVWAIRKQRLEANATFAQWEKVKRFALLPEEFSVEKGEMTAKLSLRRKIIMEHNAEVIDRIYQ